MEAEGISNRRDGMCKSPWQMYFEEQPYAETMKMER